MQKMTDILQFTNFYGTSLEQFCYVRIVTRIQGRIAQLVAYQLGTGEVPGSNSGKG